MAKAEASGVQLTDEAVQALLTLRAEHASEILEAVAEKHTTLRDPSNYVVATIARGYQPRNDAPPERRASDGKGRDRGDRGSLYETVYGSKRDRDYRDRDFDRDSRDKGYGKSDSKSDGKGKGKQPSVNLPNDVTPLESAVLELNEMNLWSGQEINCATLITLRCLGEDDAIDMLSNLQSKGQGKGGKGISNLNNYIQAAVSKVVREGGGGKNTSDAKGGSRNHTGNHSRDKARELGLDLDESTYKILSHMPLRSAVRLLERAASEADPISFIEVEAESIAEEEGSYPKRARMA